jgi:hypothetical protein
LFAFGRVTGFFVVPPLCKKVGMGQVEVENILQLSQPPVIYRTFLFCKIPASLSSNITALTGV